MKFNLIFLIGSLFFAGLFFYFLITPPSVFNYFPYLIYHGLGIEIINESQFIRIFDLIFSLIVSFLIFRFMKSFFIKPK